MALAFFGGNDFLLTICTWVWGDKYGPHYVERLARGLTKHLKTPFRFRVFTPSEEDEPLTQIPGCLARLRMFDPDWQKANYIDDHLVCMDLDCVITGSLDDVFNRKEDFVILQGANSSNPCKFNGSLMMLKAGRHAEVWNDFTIEALEKIPRYEYPDDQGWLWHKIPNAAGWQVGKESGVYAFHKPGWPSGNNLPVDAKIVVFPGWRDPVKFQDKVPWIKQHWVHH